MRRILQLLGLFALSAFTLPAQTISFSQRDFDLGPYLRFPASVAMGDFNGDGKPDLAVANSGADNILVLLGSGDGTFQPKANFAAGKNPASIAVGDFNADGISDLVVANRGSNTVSVLLGK